MSQLPLWSTNGTIEREIERDKEKTLGLENFKFKQIPTNKGLQSKANNVKYKQLKIYKGTQRIMGNFHILSCCVLCMILVYRSS